MGTPSFPHLFSELTVGSVTLKNRILSSGHDTVMAENGQVTDRLIAYQEARAAGGAGLIVLQVSGVHETAKYTYHVLMADNDDGIPGYRALAEAVHAHGLQGLRAALSRRTRNHGKPRRFSAGVPGTIVGAQRALSRHAPRNAVSLIDEVIAGYGSAARRLKEAGLDGAEIVASHGYLPAQFLNPRVNVRTDQYGGNDENRLRFLREVLTAVRQEVGDDFVVGLRISAGEESEEGLTVEEALDALRALNADRTLDYVSVVAGTSATLSGSRPHRAADELPGCLHRSTGSKGQAGG